MQVKRFFHHIAISVNPTKYRQVVEKTFGQTLGLYFFTLGFSLLILFGIGFLELQSVFTAAKGVVGPLLTDVAEPSIVLLPGIVLFVGVVLFIASQLITLLSALLMKVSVKKAVSFRDAWVLCLHAILVPLFLFILFLPFAKSFWSAIIMFSFYAIFVVIGTSLVAGKTLKSAPSAKDSFHK